MKAIRVPVKKGAMERKKLDRSTHDPVSTYGGSICPVRCLLPPPPSPSQHSSVDADEDRLNQHGGRDGTGKPAAATAAAERDMPANGD